MRRLPMPPFSAREALDLCIQSIRDTDLKLRLGHAATAMDAAETEYVRHGNESTLHLVICTQDVSSVSASEMGRVYAGTFVKSSRTRHIYDAIKSAPENDICPLCGQRTVSTLDHYLPQSTHSALVVTSANLVPACWECNWIKLAREAANAEEQTLHPYFDKVDADRWLFAEVRQTAPAALHFSAIPPDAWPAVIRQRVVSHFQTFELSKLYASHAAVELGNIRFGLEQLAAVGATKIAEHLATRADSCAAANPNSWQRATYQALADSEWFCGGGFR